MYCMKMGAMSIRLQPFCLTKVIRRISQNKHQRRSRLVEWMIYS
jgi:hypothetical protein